MQKLLTKIEVAEFLGVSPRTVDRYADAGLIESLKLPGRVRYAQKAIEAFIQKLTNGDAK